MPIAYWFGYFIWFAMAVYVSYRGMHATVRAYQQARYWKVVGFGAIAATFVIYVLVKLWLDALWHDISLVYSAPAAPIVISFRLIMIWLERRYSTI